MKLSDSTLTVLKNFAGINNSILVKEGNQLRTISVAKNILAEADITEDFPRDVAIYDHNQFLNGLILHQDTFEAKGLIEDKTQIMNPRSVNNIINKGGTILKSARCSEFHNTEGRKKAFETILGRKLTLGNLDEVAKRIETRTTIPANRDLMAEISLIEPDNDVADTITNIKGKPIKGEKRISIGDEIRKAGNSLAGYLDGQKEQPKGPVERRFIEKVFGQVLPILQQQNPDQQYQ